MKKNILLLLIAILFLCNIPSVMFGGGKQDHDKDLRLVLFGNYYTDLNESGREKFKSLADAATLCVDQFSSNETERKDEELFNNLNERIGFSFTYDDIQLLKREDGKFVNAKTHRRYTHRGWDFSTYPIPGLWEKRKKILTATVNRELFMDELGFIEKIPIVGKYIDNETACNNQCEAFCKLIYYVHILGDYEAATSYSDEFQQLIPLVSRGRKDPGAPTLIDELIDVIQILFYAQSWRYSALISELESIKTRAGKALYAVGGLKDNQELFDDYHQCAIDVIKTLRLYIPDMLKKTDYFSVAFYK